MGESESLTCVGAGDTPLCSQVRDTIKGAIARIFVACDLLQKEGNETANYAGAIRSNLKLVRPIWHMASLWARSARGVEEQGRKSLRSSLPLRWPL